MGCAVKIDVWNAGKRAVGGAFEVGLSNWVECGATYGMGKAAGKPRLEDVAEAAHHLTDAPAAFLLSHGILALVGMAGDSGKSTQFLVSLAAKFDM